MSDFNVRSDSVDVEQVMEQIRARIREKRGVDYTEQQIRELAAVKLDKILDPRGVRSDLLAEFRKARPSATPYDVPLYAFEESTLFDSHRGIVRFIRRLLKPFSKLVFNANALAQSLQNQVVINRQTVERLDRLEGYAPLYYELLHNLVLELTRATIEVKNMKMRVESLASRLEFNERRARALESAVVYKGEESIAGADRGATERDRGGRVQADRRPQTSTSAPDVRLRPDPTIPSQPTTPDEVRLKPDAVGSAPPVGSTPPTGMQPMAVGSSQGVAGEGPGQRSRRRRRRRGRRGGASAVATMGGGEGAVAQPQSPSAYPSSAPEDGRQTRAESIENAFGSATHPAEPAPGATSDAPPAPAAPPDASDTPDSDGQ
jgi:predicted component of type VI protein secretion system